MLKAGRNKRTVNKWIERDQKVDETNGLDCNYLNYNAYLCVLSSPRLNVAPLLMVSYDNIDIK